MIFVEKELTRKVSSSASAVKRIANVNGAFEWGEGQDSQGEYEAPGGRLSAVRKGAGGGKDALERRIRRHPERPLREPPPGVECVPLLTRADDGHLTKQIVVKRGENGQPDRLDKADCWMAKWYEEPEYVTVRNLREFHAALVAARKRQKTSFFLGCFEGSAPNGFVRKVKSGVERHRVKDRETALYVMDVDNATCDHEEYVRDPGSVVAKIRARLGWPWTACAVGWHLSPSGGVTHGMAKFHLEFFCSRKLVESERLRLWAAASLAYGEDIPGKDAFDFRACWAHQHLFIADPIVTPEAESHIAAHPEDRLPEIREGILEGEVDELDVDLILKTAPGVRKAKAKTKVKPTDAPVPTDDFGDEIDPIKASAKVKRAVATGVLRPRSKGEFVRYPDKYLLSAIPEGLKKLMDLRFGIDGPVTEGSNTFALAWGELAAIDEICYCQPGMADDVIDGVRHRFPDKDDAWWRRRLSGVALRLDLHKRDYVSDLGDGVIRTPICTRRKANWIALLNVTDAEQVAIPELRTETVARRMDRREKGLVKSKEDRAAALAERNAEVLRLKAEGKTAREIGAVVDLTPAVVNNLLSKLRKQGVAAESTSNISCRTTASLPSVISLCGDESTTPEDSGVVYTGIYGVHPQREDSVPHRTLAGLGASLGAAKAAEDIRAEGDDEGAQDAFGWRLDPEEDDREDQDAERPQETPATQATRSDDAPAPVEDFLAAFEGEAVAPTGADDDGSVWPDEATREDFDVDVAGLPEDERVRRAEAAITVILNGGSKADLMALYPESTALAAVLRQVALRAGETGMGPMVAAAVTAYGWTPYDTAREAEWNTRAARSAPSAKQVGFLEALVVKTGTKADRLAWSDFRRCSREIDRLQDILARRQAREARKAARRQVASAK